MRIFEFEERFIGLASTVKWTGVAVSAFVLAVLVIERLVLLLGAVPEIGSPYPNVVIFALVLAIVSVPLSLAWFILEFGFAEEKE